MKKVIVIGAGLGGLSAAFMLQSKGAAVTVLDENLHAACVQGSDQANGQKSGRLLSI